MLIAKCGRLEGLLLPTREFLLPGEGRTHIYSVLTMTEEASKRCLTRFKCPFLTTAH